MLHTLIAGLLLALLPQSPAARLDVGVSVSGLATAAPVAQSFALPSGPTTIYIYSATTICSARTVSTTKPTTAGNGWRLEISPAKFDRPLIGVALNVTWQRLWESRTELTNGPKQTQLLLMQQDSFVPLDTIDVDGVRFAREARTRLEQWQPGQPLPPEIQQDMFVQNMQGMVAARTGDKMRMIRENGYADTHPAVIAINDEIAALQRPLTNRVKTLIADRLQKMASAPPAPVDGSTAQGMTLTLGVSAPRTVTDR